MKVPFFNYAEQFLPNRETYLEIIDRAYSAGHFLLSDEVTQFENILAEKCDRKYGISLSSATDGLAFQLLAADIKPGDEVLVSGLSFISSVSSIVRIGAIPKFLDIDPNYYMMDLDQIESQITPKTKAIVAVQLFGQLMDSKKLCQIADQFGIKVFEDAAQAFGATDEGQPAGKLGTSSAMSFDPSKVLGGFCTGGVVLTDEEDVYHNMINLRRHGIIEGDITDKMGYNSLLSAAMASVLTFKLSLFEEENIRRHKIADYFLENLAKYPLSLPKIRTGSTTNWHKFVILAEKRDRLREHLNDCGVETRIHYSAPLYRQGFLNSTVDPKLFPKTESFCTNTLSLPIYSGLSDEQVEHVVDSVKSFF